mmetsp:Transcript_5922/g.16926  ORF Transcript_5922/g.16926 Transcript_5922/m.16926 type:complete len:1162 (-) Transcript_5922:780-4265(-)
MDDRAAAPIRIDDPKKTVTSPDGADNLLATGTLAHDGVTPLTDTSDWQKALDIVVSSCVVLRITQNRAFDTEAATSSYATGFVVDEDLGIILTNRHVVSPGPTTCEAVFLNREELPVRPLYYDPVHDFGFLAFDPTQLQFMKSGNIALDPAAARVGLEVRVVGNDSGEKLSILSGTLARLDRDAPMYSRQGYNDFNTFYLQAASGTKGGSSGSPVIDSRGRAVGLNAGGKNKASSAYYLPLHRVVRALGILQEHLRTKGVGSWSARCIPRGDLLATFSFKGFEEVRRLGLQRDTEALVRGADIKIAKGSGAEQRTGMLVVDSVLPGGPAQGRVQPGDALVRLNGAVLTTFLPLEEALDAAVGGSVKLDIERAGVPMQLDIEVQDLHDVTPSEFLEMAGGIFHSLSYQQARNMTMATGAVYVAESGFMLDRALVPKQALVVSVDHKETPTLRDLCRVVAGLRPASCVSLQYCTFAKRRSPVTVVVHVDWQWHGPPKLWHRVDSQGTWEWTAEFAPGVQPALLEQPPPPAPAQPPAAEPAEDIPLPEPAATALDGAVDADLGTTEFEIRLRSCLVEVGVGLPVVALPDGVYSTMFKGAGVILHLTDSYGLVLTDRNTVMVASGEITLDFIAFPCEVEGKVRFLHPLHNWALVSFQTSDLTPEARRVVRAAQMSEIEVQRGDNVWLVGLAEGHTIVRRQSTVITSTMAVAVQPPSVPRFRAVHEEVIKLDQTFGSSTSGVLTDGQARVMALWGSYSEQRRGEELEWMAGCPSRSFAPWVRTLAAALDGAPPGAAVPAAALQVAVLNAELRGLGLAKAAQQGLPADWVTKLTLLDPHRRQVLQVRSCLAGSSASEQLQAGDMLLAVSGTPVSSFPALDSLLEDLTAAAAALGAPLPNGVLDTAQADGGQEEAGTKRGRQSPPEGQPPHKRNCGWDGAPLPPPNGIPNPAPQEQQPDSAARKLEDAHVRADAETGAQTGANSRQGAGGGQAAVALTICRAGQLREVCLRLETEAGLGTTHLVHFAGAQFQDSHRAVRELGYLPPQGGVFISRWHHGSPAHRYGLFGLHWLTEMDGQPIPDMEALVRVASALKDETFVRCVLVELHSAKMKVLSVKTDLRYWPCWELKMDPATAKWRRTVLTTPQAFARSSCGGGLAVPKDAAKTET